MKNLFSFTIGILLAILLPIFLTFSTQTSAAPFFLPSTHAVSTPDVSRQSNHGADMVFYVNAHDPADVLHLTPDKPVTRDGWQQNSGCSAAQTHYSKNQHEIPDPLGRFKTDHPA